MLLKELFVADKWKQNHAKPRMIQQNKTLNKNI
jgi:hypothetical protein